MTKQDQFAERISDNLKRIRERIAAAAEKSGRTGEAVRLIAVTKTVGCDEVRAAIRAGQRDFAENRVQMLEEKLAGLAEFAALPAAAHPAVYPAEEKEEDAQRQESPTISWHLIGRLQTNKVRHCADKVCLIHSLDRLPLAEEISRFAGKRGIDVHCLLELNVSGEESKAGLAPSEIGRFLEGFSALEHIYLDGLMTMAPLGAEESLLRKIFAKTREISIDISRQNLHNVDMTELSMGMSGDFEAAILEGATMVRIGTAIFS